MNFIILILILKVIDAHKVDQTLVTANNLFAASIYKEFSKTGQDNFVISPFSAETVLTLAQFGSDGETKKELLTILNISNNENETKTAFRNLLSKLKSGKLDHFHAANKLYLKQGFIIKDEFKKVANDVFDADLESIQFVPRRLEAAETMNKWVEVQTENKIQNLVDFEKLTEDTIAVLINALYFKGNWKLPFDQYSTKKSVFYQTDKNETVDMMYSHQNLATFRYAENEELDAKFLEFPFKSKDVSMVIALPNNKNGINYLESYIDNVFQPQKYYKEHVDISLPKFKITTRIDFKDVLQNLGVTKAFTAGVADFSRISDQSLYISEIVQKTFLDLNENGVTAAAATAISMTTFSYRETNFVFKKFHVDHPFIFFIKINDLVVFAGRVIMPSY